MKINEFIAELAELEGEEKLEWLVDFAAELPELSRHTKAIPFPESCLVKECQTPVHLWVDVVDGRFCIEADVPRNSPMVRGLVAMAVVGLNGELASDLNGLPGDLVSSCGLESVLGMTRQQGFRGVMARIKQAAQKSEQSRDA